MKATIAALVVEMSGFGKFSSNGFEFIENLIFKI